MTNFTPLGCDVVALYPYAYSEKTTADRSQVDWSMSLSLPYALDILRSRGWDAVRNPLIGVPQAMGSPNPAKGEYILPEADDIAAQTAAYCKAGAIAILPYAWNDNRTDIPNELYNTANLREGLQRGLQECAQYWNNRSLVVAPSSSASATPPRPQKLSVVCSANNTSMKMRWDVAPTAERYQIAGNYMLADSSPGEGFQFDDYTNNSLSITVTPGEMVHWWVYPFNSVGRGDVAGAFSTCGGAASKTAGIKLASAPTALENALQKLLIMLK